MAQTWDDIVDRLIEINDRRQAAGVNISLRLAPDGEPATLTVRDDDGGADLTFVRHAYRDVLWLVQLAGQLMERIDKEVKNRDRARGTAVALEQEVAAVRDYLVKTADEARDAADRHPQRDRILVHHRTAADAAELIRDEVLDILGEPDGGAS